MHKTTSCLQRLQQDLVEPRVKSRPCRIPHTFDKAHHWVQDRVSAQALSTYLVMFRMRRGQPVSPSKRLIGARRGITLRTVFNHTAELVEARLMRIVRRPIPGRNRHYTNIYIFLDHEGNDLKPMEQNFHEKKKQILKPSSTSTTAPERGGEKSKLQVFWESRFAHDRKDSRWRRAQYEQKAREWDDAKQWRLNKAFERTRMAMKARQGSWGEDTTPMGEEEMAGIRERIALAELKTKQKYMTA